MKSIQASDTFRELYYNIIDELFKEILDANINLCLRSSGIQYELCGKFEDYRKQALSYMEGNRLDRHKLAACICGAVTEVQPLTGVGHAKISMTTNEKFAIFVGMQTVKLYMQYELLCKLEKQEQKDALLAYLQSHFKMYFPSEHICDTPNYLNNLSNALYWCHKECRTLKKQCFESYDILAYSTIFYHLELYNKPRIEQCYEEFLKTIDKG